MYEYARENKKIEIQEREINIYEFEIIKFTDPYIEFKNYLFKRNLYKIYCK